MCGLPPFVDEMIDVFIDDDTVYVGVPRLFTRPLRLTAPEGFALVAAGRAAMQLPGADPTGPLGRGLRQAGRRARRRRASSSTCRSRRRSTQRSTTLADGDRDGRAAARASTGRRRATRSPSARSRRGGCSTTAASGTSWPTTGAPASGARSASTASSRSSRPASTASRSSRRRRRPARRDWFADGGLPRVTLRLAPAARWVVERYPVDDVVERRRRRRRRHVPGGQRALARAPAAAPRAPRPRCVEPAGVADARAPTSRRGCWRATPSAAAASRAGRGRPRRRRRGRRAGGGARRRGAGVARARRGGARAATS